MTVMLQSLRITADLDTGGYVRGANAKVSADKQMADSSAAVGRALAATDAALTKPIAGVARLSREFITGYGDAAKFEAAIRRVGNAVDRGMALEKAFMILDSIYRKFALTANGATLAKDGFSSIVPAVDSLNRKMEAQAAIVERNTVAAQRMAAAQQSQATMNARFGIRDDFGTDQRAADIAAYGTELDRLRAKFNPLFAAQQLYRAELDEINQALRVGAISEVERAAAMMRTKDAFAQNVIAMNAGRTAIGGMAAGSKLAGHEVANLSYQFNDMAVMLASGQAPFVMLMQQGMQIGQLLGPRGLRGAVQALGTGFVSFLTNPINLAVIGFAALAGVASHLFSEMDSELPTIEKALEAHKKIVDEITAAYGGWAEASLKAGRESNRMLDMRARSDQQALRTVLNQTGRDIVKDTGFQEFIPRSRSGMVLGPQIQTISSEFKPFQDAIADFQKSIRSGSPDFVTLRENIAGISDANPSLRSSAEQLMQWTEAAKDAQLEGKALSKTLAAIPTHRQGQDRDGGYEQYLALQTDSLRRSGDIDRRAIYAKSPSERANVAADRERLAIRFEEISAEEKLLKIEIARQQAYEEASHAITEAGRERTRASEEARSAAQLELELIGKTPAEIARLRANYESYTQIRREAEDNSIQFDQAQYERLKLLNAETARLVALTALKEAARERTIAAADSVLAAQLEIQLIGKTAAEIALMRANFESYSQLRREAEENNLGFDQAQYERLQRLNEQTARLVQLQAERKLSDDLGFELQQIGRDPVEAGIAQQLRSSGIGADSQQGKVLAQQMRVNEQLRMTKSLASDAMKGFVADLRSGVTVIEALSNALGKFADKLLDLAMDQALSQLFGLFIGGAAPTLPGVGPGGSGFLHFGGPRAGGGRAERGMSYLVGEKHPELFVPDQSGTIFPSSVFGAPANSNRAGNSAPTIQVFDQRTSNSEPIEPKQDSKGNLQLYVRDALKRELPRAMAPIMSAQYGIGPRLKRN